MIDLRSLEVFFWVVKLGGFGRAAERLHMTQPAISGRISQIEARFGVRLLDRSTSRGPVPTPKGLELFVHAGRMLALGDEIVSCLAERSGLSGTLRLGAAETLVHTLLGGLLARLHQDHPGVTPEVTVDISPNLGAALLSGELDLALMLGPVTEPRIVAVPLCAYELAWVASPRLPLGAQPLALGELARWPILSYARGTLPHAQVSDLFGRTDLPRTRIFANSSLSTILRMAVDGIGIGVVPRVLAGPDIEHGRLRLLEVEPVLPALHFAACHVALPGPSLAGMVARLAATLARDR